MAVTWSANLDNSVPSAIIKISIECPPHARPHCKTSEKTLRSLVFEYSSVSFAKRIPTARAHRCAICLRMSLDFSQNTFCSPSSSSNSSSFMQAVYAIESLGLLKNPFRRKEKKKKRQNSFHPQYDRFVCNVSYFRPRG